VESDGSATWVRFSFETGGSEGEASLLLDLKNGRAVLPLGAREEEHVQRLTLEERSLDHRDREAAAAASHQAIETWRRAWQAGSFRIQHGDVLVGELQFRAGSPAQLGFYEVSWMTRGIVDALQLDEGPDLVLIFDAEPTLDGEPSILRVNRPTNRAVVPLGLLPSPVEKIYQLVPGSVDSEERSEAQAMATLSAGQRELEVGLKLGVALAEKASAVFFTSPESTCPKLADLGPDWTALMAGYDVTLVREGDGCGVLLEPVRVQHGRRLAAHISATGQVLESVLRGL
jgi:hypothetical protein